ncbi:MAG: Mo-dependent nitrogenase C-terminal domain-containing protein [Leptodesmis sp.]
MNFWSYWDSNLNPFYEQLVELRFKSLMYLAEQCGEDITFYC